MPARGLGAVCLAAVLVCAGCALRGAAAAPAAAPAATAASMRSYFVVLLKRGPAWTAERTPAAVALSEGHMANIDRMAAAHTLVLAGPFDADDADRGALAGIFVLDVPTIEEARALVAKDPAVAAGRFTVEILPWYGPAGITYAGAPR